MDFKYQYSIEGIDWTELSRLYKRAPLGDKRPKDLGVVFSNSLFKCFIFESGILVGAGRALADGIDCSYICDVAVLPGYQSLGLGKQIVSKLINLSKGHAKIVLYSFPGKEAFYKKLGFKRMSTAMAIFDNQDQALEQGLINET